MEKTIISIKELAERRSCSEGYIYKLEQNGLLTRTKLSKVCFPISQIKEIEMSEEPSPTLQDVKRLREENRKLNRENKSLRKSLYEASQVLYEGYEV